MSVLHIPEDVLEQAGITEREAVIELACSLFDTGRLTLFFSAKLAGLSQGEFQEVLSDRKIPIYRYTEDDLKNDLQNLQRAGV
jgi:predicted HTH domain antitoxin